VKKETLLFCLALNGKVMVVFIINILSQLEFIFFVNFENLYLKAEKI
jgi:hypothetical protein